MKQISLVAMVTCFLSLFAGNHAKAQGSYCTAGSNDNNVGITYVGLNTISNTSVYGVGYEDFTALSTNIVAGSMSNGMNLVLVNDGIHFRLTVFTILFQLL